jgi:hypothetical protein
MISRGHAPSRETGSASALLWYRRLVWAGIAANLVLGAAGLFVPGLLLSLLGLEQAQPQVWPRFAAFLLILLSIFYIPAARDPVGNRFSAVFTVVCRFGGVLFFAVIGGSYLLFGLYDLIFGLPQAIALWRGLTARLPLAGPGGAHA